MKIYSPTTNGFYHPELHGAAIPADAVEFTDAEHRALLDAQTRGRIIQPGPDGYPIAVEPPPPPAPTTDELAASVRAERDRRIEAVRWRIERHEEQVQLGLTPDEPLEPILSYRQALRDIPQQEGFPWSGSDDPAIPWPDEIPEPATAETSEV